MEAILRSIFGLFILISICVLLSSHRNKISWRETFYAFGIQVLFAFLVLKVPGVMDFFDFPMAWIIGVDSDDITKVGQLLGEKTVLNEFYAYGTLAQFKASASFAHQRSLIIATYALCGFANFASIGIQVGDISQLVPSQRKSLSELGIKALIGGTICTLMTATIDGAFY